MDFSNPTFWIAIAFVTFFALFGKKIWGMLAKSLDSRSAAIAQELAQAEALRREAEELLALYRRKYDESIKEAEDIIARARASAEALSIKSDEEMRANLDRRMKQAESRIEEEEKRAIAEVRNHMVDITIAAAHAVIAEQLRNASDDQAVQNAIADLRKVH